ncbi:MAG: translocation/assembly module TamB domain-containing protein, partial [Desulfovibrio sp.]|uniref:translocation/assembly module TamB domain-containing protein n=1 Tax=Desulfovibrio sp. TaxID=885 RepID=UPI0039E3599A
QGVLLTNINLRLNLEEGRGGNSGKKQGGLPGIARLELDASGGLGGKLRVAGFANLDGSKLDIKTTIDHLRPLSRRDIRIELSGEAGVTGSAAAPHVDGKIIVNQGLVQLNKLAVGGSVTTLPISETPAVSQASQVAAPEKPAAQGSLNLNIVIPGRFIVEGHGLTSEWKADILISGTPEDPQVTGQVTAVKGSFDFLTKIFKLSRGTITFAGGALSNPLLDIKLSNETPNLTSYVTISGTVRKMKLSLSSEPELPRDEILAQILFGKSTNELGRLENLRLAGAVAQLAGFGSSEGGIFDMTRKALGVDVLRLNSASGQNSGDQSGDESMGAGTSVEMGKYITDIIYIGVQQGMKQGSTAFIIQLEITPRTSLELRSEQQNTWGGIRWKYNY